jgi:hypothetical protein
MITAPETLQTLQKWFADLITQPIAPNSKIHKTAPNGSPIDAEVAKYITPTPQLKPSERLQIYHQQYWWRLFTILQENYPITLRLFGYHDFNQHLAVPYLMRHPSEHWSLNGLGTRLPQWIATEYEGKEKTLLIHAATIDGAFIASFIAADSKTLENIDEGMEGRLRLSAHVHLFELPYDLFEFRIPFLAQPPQYWIDNEFPTLTHAKNGEFFHFVLFRNRSNAVEVVKILSPEYHALKHFAAGATLDALCEWLEKEADASTQQEATCHLQSWFQRWIGLRWLSHDCL